MNAPKKNTFLIGVNHESAPLEVRERVAFEGGLLSVACANLKREVGVDESLILSTCNRTEIYVCCEDYQPVLRWIAMEKGVPEGVLSSHIYTRSAHEVLTHAAMVASGMGSMVIGETQIFGQMKAAYKHADDARCLGQSLRKIFDLSFSIAKEVRTSTAIGSHTVSMASSSLRAAERIFPDLLERSVLFIGAGEMINLFAQQFSTKKFKSFGFSNRTMDKASNLALKHGGEVVDITNLVRTLNRYDIVVSCTASPIPILGKGAFESALMQRRHEPVVVFDLAVPRDIEISVNALDDVFVFTVDDLGELIRQSLTIRQSALNEAKKIIARRVHEYINLTESDESVTAVKAFRQLGDKIVGEEKDKSILALRRGDDPEEVVRRLSISLGQKFMDRPSRAFKGLKVGDRAGLAQSLRKLFEIDDPS